MNELGEKYTPHGAEEWTASIKAKNPGVQEQQQEQLDREKISKQVAEVLNAKISEMELPAAVSSYLTHATDEENWSSPGYSGYSPKMVEAGLPDNLNNYHKTTSLLRFARGKRDTIYAGLSQALSSNVGRSQSFAGEQASEVYGGLFAKKLLGIVDKPGKVDKNFAGNDHNEQVVYELDLPGLPGEVELVVHYNPQKLSDHDRGVMNPTFSQVAYKRSDTESRRSEYPIMSAGFRKKSV